MTYFLDSENIERKYLMHAHVYALVFAQSSQKATVHQQAGCDILSLNKKLHFFYTMASLSSE